MAAAAESRPRTARPTTAPPRVEWQTPKTAVVIPRLLSKQSRRVTGSEPASRSMRSVEYNILAPPPPTGDMTPRTSLGRVAHKARSEEASFTSSLASARGRSKSDFMRSSVPLDHVTENKAPPPASASGSSTARTMGESSSLASFRSSGGDISSPRGGKRIVVREERRPKPQTSKAMVANTHASRSHLGTTSGLAGAPVSEPSASSSSSSGNGHHGGRGMSHSRSQVMAAAPERRGLAAGAGRTHEAFASSSVSYNILSPPSTGPVGPKPSRSYAFIASQHGTHAAGGGVKK